MPAISLTFVAAAVPAALLARDGVRAWWVPTVAFLFLIQFVAIEWVSVTNGSSGLTLPLPDWPEAWGNWPFHLILVALLAAGPVGTGWIAWRWISRLPAPGRCGSS